MTYFSANPERIRPGQTTALSSDRTDETQPASDDPERGHGRRTKVSPPRRRTRTRRSLREARSSSLPHHGERPLQPGERSVSPKSPASNRDRIRTAAPSPSTSAETNAVDSGSGTPGTHAIAPVDPEAVAPVDPIVADRVPDATLRSRRSSRDRSSTWSGGATTVRRNCRGVRDRRPVRIGADSGFAVEALRRGRVGRSDCPAAARAGVCDRIEEIEAVPTLIHGRQLNAKAAIRTLAAGRNVSIRLKAMGCHRFPSASGHNTICRVSFFASDVGDSSSPCFFFIREGEVQHSFPPRRLSRPQYRRYRCRIGTKEPHLRLPADLRRVSFRSISTVHHGRRDPAQLSKDRRCRR